MNASLADARVVVLAGGLSYERDVSLRSGRRLADALTRAGVHVELRDIDTTLLPSLTTDPPDAVVFGLHGPVGEDGALRAVLDLIDVPYVGPTADAARRAWDKATAKAALRDAGIDTPDWITLPKSTFSDLGAGALLDRIADRLGMPLVVKPSAGGSGLGVQVTTSPEELPSAMIGCFAYGDVALIERYAPGRDIAVGVLDVGDGPTPLPAVEIVPADGHYDYAARYNPGGSTWHVPARLDADVARRLDAIALDVFAALDMRDLSRVDFRVAEDGTPTVLEANVVPGMTETSLIPLAAEAAGLDMAEVLSSLVARAVDRSRARRSPAS